MDRILTVFYTSDIHGYFSPVDYAANSAAPTGLSNCAAQFRKDGNTLILDGGDTLQGSPFTYWLRHAGPSGHSIPARLMNLAGYDFITLGNHDFNYGRSVLEQYLSELDAVCLCANVEGFSQIRKTAVTTLENGLRVGLTGIVTDFINRWEKPENLAGICITDPVQAARQALSELKAQACDLTVCLYHGGFENDLDTGKLLSDTGENRAWELCRDLDFDILLTGHQHMALEQAELFGTFTCQPPDKAGCFIRMEVTVSEDGVRAESRLLPAGGKTLSLMAEELKPLDAAVAVWLDRPVGHLDLPLRPETPLHMAAQGSLIANFFNQVQLASSGAEISATCLGNEIRGFDRDVSIRDVVATYIYPNSLKTILVSREILRRALERSAEYFDFDAHGGLCVSETFLKPKVEHYNFDYFSGIETVIDVRRPVGDRVLSIRWQGQELPEDRMLSLCLNNYRASGAGGYDFYADCEVLRENPTEIVELIMDYITAHPEIQVDRTHWLNVIFC